MMQDINTYLGSGISPNNTLAHLQTKLGNNYHLNLFKKNNSIFREIPVVLWSDL